MNIHEYKIFLDVCNTKNFSETARNNFITKSAIIQHINKLEQKLGIKLFERTSRGVNLTDAGKALQPLAKGIIEKESEIIKTMHDYSHTLTIGTIYLEKPILINTVLQKNNSKLKDFNINFQEVKNIKNVDNQIDIIEYYEITKYLDHSFNFLKLREEPIYIAMPPSHPLSCKSSITLKDLSNYTVAIEKNGISAMGDKISNILKRNPKINIKSFGVYNSSFFATALYHNYLMCISKGMAPAAKPYIVKPLNIKQKAYYGIYYRRNPSNTIKQFLSAL